MRKILALVILTLALSGCERPFEGGRAFSPAHLLMRPPAPDGTDNQTFSFMHTLAIDMPHTSVERRYDRARGRCLHDAQLGCKLVSSSLEKSDSTGSSAQLVVALPHDRIAAYEQSLLAPVTDEKAGDAKITSRSTTAQNVSQEAASADRKVAQLSDYRDRLLALSKRPGLSVDDLIKIQSELSKVENDLNDALSQKSATDDRVSREQISIFLNERPEEAGAFAPVAGVWRNAVDILGENTASALRFLIAIIPWLPLIAAAIFLIRWLWRIARRRPRVARSAPD